MSIFIVLPLQVFCYQMTRTCNEWDVQIKPPRSKVGDVKFTMYGANHMQILKIGCGRLLTIKNEKNRI